MTPMAATHTMRADPVRPFGKLQARILAETLPYLRAYHSKIFVVDYALPGTGNPAAWNSLGRDLALHRLSASELEALAPMGEHRHLAEALRAGVGAVHVVDARHPEVLLLEILTRDSQGSLVLPDPAAGVIDCSAHYLDLSQYGDESDETH